VDRLQQKLSALVLLSLVVGALASCASESEEDRSGPSIRAEGSGTEGANFPGTKDRIAYVVMLRSVCTTGAPIKITSVSAAGSKGGMSISSWGLQHRPHGDGPVVVVPPRGSVSQMPAFGHYEVTAVCGNPAQDSDWFAISASRSSKTQGSMTGVWIHYGNGHKVFSQYELTTCSAHQCKTSRH